MSLSSRRIRWGALEAPRAASLAVVFVGVVAASAIAQDVPRRVMVRAAGYEAGETPVTVRLKDKVAENIYILQRESDGKSFPAWIYKDGDVLYLSTVLDRVSADKDESYKISIRTSDIQSGPGVELGRTGTAGVTEVTIDAKPFTNYRTDQGPKPILYPLIGPTGQPFTRDYPMKNVDGEERDHPHQRSFWFTHGKVNGIDFWSEAKGHGTIRERNRNSRSGGQASAVVDSVNDWIGPDGKKVCEDERRFTFYGTKDTRVIDVDVTVKATEGPLTFGDTKEGMFGLRVASSMDVKRKQGGKITNAEGINDLAAWGKPSPWVDYVGPVQGETVGVAILNHPSSFRLLSDS